MIYIKSPKEIEKMKEACRVAFLAQKAVEEAIKPGITTYDLDKIAEEEKYDGYYSIVTSEKHLSDKEIRDIYKGLWRYF